MEIRFSNEARTESLVLHAVDKAALDQLALPDLSAEATALVRAAATAQRFEGEAGAIVETVIPHDGGVARIGLIGIGSGDEPAMEKAGGAVTARYLVSGTDAVAIDMAAVSPTARAAVRFALAARLRAWRHDVYRTKLSDKARPSLKRVTIHHAPADAANGWTDALALAEGVEFTRTLVAEPANILYPESFVDRCRDLADLGIELTVLDDAQMRALGMGSLLGVSQGSVREARVLAMRWDGTGNGGNPSVALVGKGVTFDTGGISLKPGPGMEDMKWDMGGAGAVVGAMRALAGRKAKAHVIGVVGLVENMPDGNAQRPGDIVTSMSGQTIEVLNTDAEGRLVLCDVLTWVQRNYRPGTIVDLATLTGAMIVALGHEHGGLFANDDELAAQLTAAGLATGDKLWRFPLSDAYDKLIDSPIADMKNIGPRFAGSITAAQFLKRFIDPGVRWAHLDIAGMVWSDKPGATHDKGATGYGVRLLDRFVADQFER
ncbi:leucyl aminopeptidase [Sphingomonas sp. CJ99]